MARNENPPFDRGGTFYGPNPVPAIDANNLGGLQWEGKEWLFEDLDYSKQGAKPARTNRYVRCRIVRNVSAGALLPKAMVTFQKAGTDGRFYGARVDGMVTLDADRCYPVDEWLPAAGVAVNDLFWIVVDGPATCRTSLNADATDVFNVGDPVVGLTAATSGATSAGRVQGQLQGATTPLENNVMNLVGRALSAKTTANTNTDILVEVGRW